MEEPKIYIFSKGLLCLHEEERVSWDRMAKTWQSRQTYGPYAETKNIFHLTNIKATSYLR